jgi:hypothetical protein
MRLPKGLLRVRDVAQCGVADHDIEGRIRELKGSTVSGVEGQLGETLSEFSRLLDEDGRWVDPDHFLNFGQFRENSRYGSRSTAHIQHDCFA